MRIKEYTRTDNLAKTDAFVVETSTGTKYVEQQNLGYLGSSGGTIGGNLTITGKLTVSGDPTFTKPIPVSSGGTGLSASPSLLINLASTAAANVLAAAPRPGVTGVLAVANGGTGVSSNAGIGLKAYPVGAVYISYVNTSPATLFGGSWTQITGRFLRAATDVSTGGSDTVTLTAAQSGLPSHAHNIRIKDTAGTGAAAIPDPISCKAYKAVANYMANNTAANASSSHTNMPAYQDLYVWRRTA